jgi:hypothetical protein
VPSLSFPETHVAPAGCRFGGHEYLSARARALENKSIALVVRAACPVGVRLQKSDDDSDGSSASGDADEGGMDSAIAAIGEEQGQYPLEFEHIFNGDEQIDVDAMISDDNDDEDDSDDE